MESAQLAPLASHFCAVDSLNNHTQTLSWSLRAVLQFGLIQCGIVVNTSEGQRNCFKAAPESLTIMRQVL